jgi:hypothetical protein
MQFSGGGRAITQPLRWTRDGLNLEYLRNASFSFQVIPMNWQRVMRFVFLSGLSAFQLWMAYSCFVEAEKYHAEKDLNAYMVYKDCKRSPHVQRQITKNSVILGDFALFNLLSKCLKMRRNVPLR